MVDRKSFGKLIEPEMRPFIPTAVLYALALTKEMLKGGNPAFKRQLVNAPNECIFQQLRLHGEVPTGKGQVSGSARSQELTANEGWVREQ